MFDCPRFARALDNDGTPYGVFEFVCIAPHFARNFAVGNMPYGVLYCSLLSTFRALSFAVVFSVVGSLCFLGVRGCLFLLGMFLYCSRGCIPFGDALGIL